ncbi:MAG: hypothetical protein NTY19_13380 [Planctomycetota bacterium]|nr:hypothetical protein [Planctomycetota bacterium]
MSNLVKPPPSCNVYTPAVLAQAMVCALGDVPDARWLEPCVGQGAFLKSLTRHRVDASRIVGLDLCRSPEPADVHAVVHRGIEFLRWATSTLERFDRVVANPPYVALSKVPRPIQNAALCVRTPDESPITRGGNCWNAFLCASLGLLNEGGSIAFVLPAAFDYANYARSLRTTLPTLFARLEVHRCRKPIFDSVEEGSIVLIGHGFREPRKAAFRREYESLDDLVRGLSRPSQPRRQSPTSGALIANGKGVRLGDVMTIGLGAVTGDASYFLMTDEERRRHDLPTSAVMPVLSKSKHIRSASISPERWMELLSAEERVWLFRPRAAVVPQPAVQRYLELPEADGGCRRDAYKVRNRHPWYVTPLPPRPDGFMSGMSQSGPWVCLNGMVRLSATNTLYTVRFPRRLLQDEQCAWALMLLTDIVREQLPSAVREYALGLAKLEPGDVSQLRLPNPRVVDAMLSVYRTAVESLLGGDARRACSIANKYVASPRGGAAAK